MADRNMNTDTNGKADGAVERIRAYFEANASEDLKRRAAAEGKTAAGALAYAKGQARKLAVGGCACVEDETVYGWAMHYFEDEPAEKPAGKPAEGTDAAPETAETPAETEAAEADGAETRQNAPETPSAASGPASAQTDMFAALGV